MINGFGIDEDAYRKVLGKNLTDILYERQMTKRELADKIGVSPTIVSQWCSGKKSPRMDKIDAICQVLNVKRSDIMLAKDDKLLLVEEIPTDDEIQLARQIMRLDAYRRQLIMAIINTEPETKKPNGLQ